MNALIENRTYDELQVGEEVRIVRRLVLDDLRRFADSVAALDPEHLDDSIATSDLFHGFLAHGLWGNALLALVVATRLPGVGTRLEEERLSFRGELAFGDSVEVVVTVVEKLPEGRVVLACKCTAIGGDATLEGHWVVRAPEQKMRAASDPVSALFDGGRHRQLKRMLRQAEGLEPMATVVVHPVDEPSLLGVAEAVRFGLIDPILVGPRARIEKVAREANIDLGDWPIIDTEHSHESAERAMELVREAKADIVMKGALHTDELMGAAVHKQKGIRGERRMSHVWVMDVPTYPRPLFITDSGINIAPTLEVKRDIVQNVIDLARAVGVEEPKVAILSAVETVNPAMQSTLDAAALCKMADRGQIRGGLLDGPLAFDNAISEAAARTKGIKSPVAGRADVLLAPDLEAGNMIGKQLHYLADADAAGIVLGARVPIVLTSRADDTVSRLASCAISVLMAEHQRRGGVRSDAK